MWDKVAGKVVPVLAIMLHVGIALLVQTYALGECERPALRSDRLTPGIEQDLPIQYEWV